MSKKSWDDEDVEVEVEVEVPAPQPAVVVVSDKWDGEDEEGRIKDNWDDEDESASLKRSKYVAAVPSKKKKSNLIAEKQAKKAAELEVRREEAERQSRSPEEVQAEKIRVQKVQEDSDFQLATDLMGVKEEADDDTALMSLSSLVLSTAESLDSLRTAVVDKIRTTDKLERKNFYVPFVEAFCKDLCANLDVDEVKKVTSTLNALYNDKLKAGKVTKSKKSSNKSKLHMGKEKDDQVDNSYMIDEFDDFI